MPESREIEKDAIKLREDARKRQDALQIRVDCHDKIIAAGLKHGVDPATGQVILTEEIIKYFVGLIAFDRLPFLFIAYPTPEDIKKAKDYGKPRLKGRALLKHQEKYRESLAKTLETNTEKGEETNGNAK